MKWPTSDGLVAGSAELCGPARGAAYQSCALRPGVAQHARALAQHDPRCGPALHRGVVGGLRELEVV